MQSASAGLMLNGDCMTPEGKQVCGLSPSGGGSALVLHTVKVEVHGEQVPHASQPRRYPDLSPMGSGSSIHPPPLQQPFVTTPGFSQVGASAPLP